LRPNTSPLSKRYNDIANGAALDRFVRCDGFRQRKCRLGYAVEQCLAFEGLIDALDRALAFIRVQLVN